MVPRRLLSPSSAGAASRIARGIIALGLATSTGCYRAHGRDDDAAVTRDDAGPDAARPRDAGLDAGEPSCCTRWAFDRRVAIEDFEEETVTPRLFAIRDEVGLLVTGPSDPIGASGAHFLRFSRDLASHEPPVPVTSGSFTWGQPAGRGSTFAVCWGGAGTGNAVRVYDADGRPLSEQATLDSSVESPCIASAYSGYSFAFAYARRDPATSEPRVRVRIVTRAGEIGASFDVEVDSLDTSAAVVDVHEGFAVAVGGPHAELFVIDHDGTPLARTRIANARNVRLVRDRYLRGRIVTTVTLLQVFTRTVAGTREEDVWRQARFDVPSLSPAGMLELGTFEPPPSPSFAATAGSCGEAVLGVALPALGVVEPRLGLHIYYPDAPAGTLRGDTSALVIDDDAYVAFTALDPASSRARVHVDRWICAEH